MENKLEELEKRIIELESKVLRLTISKLDNKRYPYFNWILENNISEEERFKIESVFAYLTSKLDNQEPIEFTQKFNKLFGDKLLNEEGAPTFDNAIILFEDQASLSEKSVIQLLRALYNQGVSKEIAAHLLNQGQINLDDK